MHETPSDARLHDRLAVGRVLRAMRESAHISQAAIASILECTQPQVSRFETGRDQPTLEVLVRWLLVCGGATLPHAGITVGSPYHHVWTALRELRNRLKKVSLASVPDAPADTAAFVSKELEALATTAGAVFKKPLIALTGAHNTGTSRVCNYLVQAETHEGAPTALPWLTPASAVDVVPSGYDVATKIAYFLSDVEDRPDSLQYDLLSRHDVYGFGSSYDPLTGNPVDAQMFVMEAGGLDLLHNLVHRKGEAHDTTSRVVAYLHDRPILRAGVLVDLPHVAPDPGLYPNGPQTPEAPNEPIHLNRLILGAADKIVLTSAFPDRSQQPCLFDPVAVAGALRLLASNDHDTPAMLRLDDLYLVATSARASAPEIDASFAAAAHRLQPMVDRLVRARGWEMDPFTVADLRNRMFAFLVETPRLNEQFVHDLARNLDPAGAREQLSRASGTPRIYIRRMKRAAENAADAARQNLLGRAKLLRQYEPEEHRRRADSGGRGGTHAGPVVVNAMALWRKRVDARLGASAPTSLLTCDVKALGRWVNERFPTSEDREAAEQGALFVYVSELFEELSRLLFEETQSMFHELAADFIVRSPELPFVHSIVGIEAGSSNFGSRLIVGSSRRFAMITVNGACTTVLEPDAAILVPEFALLQSAGFKTKSTSWQAQIATALARWRAKHSMEKRVARCIDCYQTDEETGLAVTLSAALRRAQSINSDVAAHVLSHRGVAARNASIASIELAADSIVRQMALFDATVPESS